MPEAETGNDEDNAAKQGGGRNLREGEMRGTA